MCASPPLVAQCRQAPVSHSVHDMELFNQLSKAMLLKHCTQCNRQQQQQQWRAAAAAALAALLPAQQPS